MTTRLSIYNDALLLCGERALASLTEDREPRYLLDQVWDNDGLNYCLEEGQWYFATRTIQIDYDTAISPPFGYQHGFTKPDDWVLTCALCSDAYFRAPLTQYVDEAGYWYADLDSLFVRYVSNDAAYGLDMARWPRIFTEFVAAQFASKMVLKLTNDDDRLARILKLRERLLSDAKNKNMMAEPTRFAARGSWSQSRNRWGARLDRGNSGQLIG